MKFRGDERGAAIQIGAVILFAFIVIAMASYQATVVPSQNSGVEFNHNQDVQSQMVDLTNGIDASAREGTRGSHSVRLGTTYPSRTFFVNPGSPSGQLRTVESGEIEFDGITVDDADNVQTFWDEADSITTSRLQYEPNYNEYRNAPTTVYEHGELINDNPRGSPTTLASGDLVEDGELSVFALQGDVQASSSSAVSVNRRALSTAENTIEVEGGTITLPVANTAYWTEWEEDTDVEEIDISVDESNNLVELEITEPVELNMAQVGLGSVSRDSPNERAAYLYEVNSATVEVRDRFNNPVSGATVDINGESEQTGANGQVSVGADRIGDDIEWSIDGSEDDEKTLGPTTVDAEDVGAVGGGGGGSSGAYDVEWNTTAIDDENPDITCSGGECTITDDSDQTLFMLTDPPADGASVQYSSGDRSVLQFDETDSTTDSDGTDSVDVSVGDDGDANVFVSSGSDGDRLRVTVDTDEDPDRTLDSIDLTLTPETIEEGSTSEAAVVATYDDGSTQDVTDEADITSDDDSIASVDGSTITGESVGTTDIAASYEEDGESADDTAEITVTEEPDNATVEVKSSTFSGQSAGVLDSDFDLNTESDSYDITINVDWPGQGDPDGGSYNSKTVEIEEETFELTETAADSIRDDEYVDIFDTDNYNDLSDSDEDYINDIGTEVTTNSNIENIQDNDDEELDVRIEPI